MHPEKATDHNTPSASWTKNQAKASFLSDSLFGTRQASHAEIAVSV